MAIGQLIGPLAPFVGNGWSMTYGAGMFVAYQPSSSTSATSQDGLAWTYYVGVIPDAASAALIYGTDNAVWIEQNDYESATLLVSGDAISWSWLEGNVNPWQQKATTSRIYTQSFPAQWHQYPGVTGSYTSADPRLLPGTITESPSGGFFALGGQWGGHTQLLLNPTGDAFLSGIMPSDATAQGTPASVTYNPANGNPLYFAATTPVENGTLGFWEYDGSAWSRVATTDVVPYWPTNSGSGDATAATSLGVACFLGGDKLHCIDDTGGLEILDLPAGIQQITPCPQGFLIRQGYSDEPAGYYILQTGAVSASCPAFWTNRLLTLQVCR